jgi:hypothetical protein
MYFAKEPAVKLGILTNGTHWRFFTDLIHDNVMDTEPFFSWDVLQDDPAAPMDLLTILQKSQFKAQLIKTFAERKHHKNLLVGELNRLLAPSPEFIKLAVQNVESRTLTEKRVEEWKPILADAIQEWAKQQTLTLALQHPNAGAKPVADQDEDESAEKAERYGIRKKYWEGLLSRPKVKATRHANITPGEYAGLWASSGIRGLSFNYVSLQDAGKVELYIDRGTGKAEENKRIFDRLHSRKAEIEGAFGGELSWERLDDKRGCRVAHTATAGGWKSDESKWPEIQDAMIDAMGRLEKALAPHLAELKTELTS